MEEVKNEVKTRNQEGRVHIGECNEQSKPTESNEVWYTFREATSKENLQKPVRPSTHIRKSNERSDVARTEQGPALQKIREENRMLGPLKNAQCTRGLGFCAF